MRGLPSNVCFINQVAAAPGVIRQRYGFKGQAAELENACAYKSPSKQVISM
jgi:hypothetical protein